MQQSPSQLIETYLVKKRTEYEMDPTLFMKDLMEFFLDQKKQMLEKDLSLVVKEMGFEQTKIEPEFFSEDEIDKMWMEIKRQYNWSEETWQILSKSDYEQKRPSELGVWKKKYSPFRSDLRYCSADLCLGFYNDSVKPLTLTLKSWVGMNAISEKIMIEPKGKSNFEKPMWFSRDIYTMIRVVEPSHEDFYILYSWFPATNKLLRQDYKDLCF